MEDCLLARRKEAGENVKARFLQLIESFWHQHKDYQSIVREYGEVSHAHQNHSLASLVDELRPDLQHRLHEAGMKWKGLRVHDEIVTWTTAQLDLIRPILLHALSNALDHGFLRASPEFQSKAAAFFEIQAQSQGGHIHLTIRDNGQGISWDKVKELAKAQGLGTLDREALGLFLFTDGVSTAASTSLSSGRGVGLAAIYDICTDIGGEVMLKDHPDHRGASLEVLIPLASWMPRAG
jgi:C4-dicarboxylate-specific signal transduction histidine kinase